MTRHRAGVAGRPVLAATAGGPELATRRCRRGAARSSLAPQNTPGDGRSRAAHQRLVGARRRAPARASPRSAGCSEIAAGSRSLTSSASGGRAPAAERAAHRVELAGQPARRPGQAEAVGLREHRRGRQRLAQPGTITYACSAQRRERLDHLAGAGPERDPGCELAGDVGAQAGRDLEHRPPGGQRRQRVRPAAAPRRRRPSRRPCRRRPGPACRSRSGPAGAVPAARGAARPAPARRGSRPLTPGQIDLVRAPPARASRSVSSSASDTDSNTVTSSWRPSARDRAEEQAEVELARARARASLTRSSLACSARNSSGRRAARRARRAGGRARPAPARARSRTSPLQWPGARASERGERLAPVGERVVDQSARRRRGPPGPCAAGRRAPSRRSAPGGTRCARPAGAPAPRRRAGRAPS